MADYSDEEAKRYLPEGHALDMDRAFTASTVVDSIDQWKDRTSTTDLKGFDTKKAREKSPRSIKKDITGGSSGKEVLEDEPERFLTHGHESREILKDKSSNFYDFKSFVKSVKEGFNSDPSLHNLIDNIYNNNSFLPLFRQPEIQEWIAQNTRGDSLAYLQKRYKIEPVKATRILDKLSTRNKAKLYRLSRRSKLPKIRHRPSKRQRYSTQELNFLKANQKLPFKQVESLYKRNFSLNRSSQSLRNMYYKVRKGDK